MQNMLRMLFKNQWIAIVTIVLFLMLTANMSLISQIKNTYPLNGNHLPFVISLMIFFSLLNAMFITVFSIGKFGKWVIALLLILAAQSAYYMDTYGVLIDTIMIGNVMQTDSKEVAGLLNMTMLLRTCFLGLLPAWIVIKYWPLTSTVRTDVFHKISAILLMGVLLVMIVWPSYAGYASFIREHRIVRFYANPTYPVYSLVKYVSQQLIAEKYTGPIIDTAPDAKLVAAGAEKHELVIMVVGETARYDRFSLNGYSRLTNPQLTKENVVSFSHVSSCGTSTRVSVPCMFSVLGRKDYEQDKALARENALDKLMDNGVAVLWRDNNSDSKGVATRVQYEDFKSPTMNPVCDKECRDVGMLSGLDDYIAAHQNQDILIVLHQLGNHGPEYYRRYPEQFEQFKPVCKTGELKDCTQEMVDNGYDNAILYTDYFLSKVIQSLKPYDDQYETAMLYVADHGESLGEKGLYLHAAPYRFAPAEQTHVPAILWLGKHFDYQLSQALPFKDYPLSHDDLYCTLLIAFEVETHTCDVKRTMLMENIDIKLARVKNNHPSSNR